jgi:hypothetical protein
MGMGGRDEPAQSCMGRPWNVLPQDHGAAPPEGDWVSRKDETSDVYTLVHLVREHSAAAADGEADER